MDIPAPTAGTVAEVLVHIGDRVSAGDLVVRLEGGSAGGEPVAAPSIAAASTASVTPGAPSGDVSAEVLVLGAGPGGYSAAFRAADLGKTVVMVDRGAALGGVCLNVGCIPSKALLHAAKVIAETKEMSEHGVVFAAPVIDVDQLRSWKESVVHRLTGGLAGLARQRKVVTIRGDGHFISSNQLQVDLSDGGTTIVDFEQAIIAAGSQPVTLPFVPQDDPRVIDSTGALELDGIPKRLLVLGGGIIGLEMATVYHELGAKVTIVELMDQLIPGADKDLVAPLTKRITKRYENIYLATRVTDVEARPEGLVVSFTGAKAPATDTFDKVLVAVGRRPNGSLIGADRAGVAVDERGFIPVDAQMRTNVAHIFAIGDVVGQPMLAHKAMHEGKVAAEVSAGKNSFFDARVIPSVAYTDPEVAWVGITENEAKTAGVTFGKGVFPWAASGRSLSLGRDEGITKLLFDETTGRIIGCGIVGPSAGDLVAEAGLAIEMGADAADISLTIHAHPTLSETVGLAAEAFEGTITDLYLPKKKPRSSP
jgi:dihydrolipoamide dehydrogenase